MSLKGVEEVDFCHITRKGSLTRFWPQNSGDVIEDMIKSEQKYITDLDNIVKVYMKPFSHQPWAKNDSDGDLTVTIFGNVDDILFVHRSLLKDMLSSSKQPADFGDVFIQHKNKFSHYKEYCKNFPMATRTLKDCMGNDVKIANFILKCDQKLKCNMPLQSFLIKPVQQIMRYHLFLERITKKLSPNFQGFTNLSKALTVMKEVAEDVNEAKRMYDRTQEIEDSLVGWKHQKLSTYGNVVLEGSLKVIGFRGQRYVIVFEKLLLVLKKVPKGNVKYHYKGHIEGNKVGVMDFKIDDHPFCFKTFSAADWNHFYLLEAKNDDEKMKWIATLLRLIKDDLRLLNTVLFEQEQQEDSIIMIQPEGLKLSHSDIKKKDAPSVLQKDDDAHAMDEGAKKTSGGHPFFDNETSQSSESDSEEEHDIDPSIHDAAVYTNIPSSHGNMDGKDQGDDNKIANVSVTAEGRFIVPTSTLDRIHSMDSTVTVSPFSWDFILDDSSDAAALDNDDDLEHNETSPLTNKDQQETRQHLRSRYLVASGRLDKDTQPLLEEGEEGDEDSVVPKAPSSSWFYNLSVGSVISYLINLGSGIGSSLFYYISGLFRPRAIPEAANSKAAR